VLRSPFFSRSARRLRTKRIPSTTSSEYALARPNADGFYLAVGSLVQPLVLSVIEINIACRRRERFSNHVELLVVSLWKRMGEIPRDCSSRGGISDPANQESKSVVQSHWQSALNLDFFQRSYKFRAFLPLTSATSCTPFYLGRREFRSSRS